MLFGKDTCRTANKPRQFELLSDWFGVMRDAKTTKPQFFRTGDGWLAYNRAVDLAQM